MRDEQICAMSRKVLVLSNETHFVISSRTHKNNSLHPPRRVQAYCIRSYFMRAFMEFTRSLFRVAEMLFRKRRSFALTSIQSCGIEL